MKATYKGYTIELVGNRYSFADRKTRRCGIADSLADAISEINNPGSTVKVPEVLEAPVSPESEVTAEEMPE